LFDTLHHYIMGANFYELPFLHSGLIPKHVDCIPLESPITMTTIVEPAPANPLHYKGVTLFVGQLPKSYTAKQVCDLLAAATEIPNVVKSINMPSQSGCCAFVVVDEKDVAACCAFNKKLLCDRYGAWKAKENDDAPEGDMNDLLNKVLKTLPKDSIALTKDIPKDTLVVEVARPRNAPPPYVPPQPIVAFQAPAPNSTSVCMCGRQHQRQWVLQQGLSCALCWRQLPLNTPVLSCDSCKVFVCSLCSRPNAPSAFFPAMGR